MVIVSNVKVLRLSEIQIISEKRKINNDNLILRTIYQIEINPINIK